MKIRGEMEGTDIWYVQPTVSITILLREFRVEPIKSCRSAVQFSLRRANIIITIIVWWASSGRPSNSADACDCLPRTANRAAIAP